MVRRTTPPSNLIPVKITGLPLLETAVGTATMVAVVEGVTYQVSFQALANAYPSVNIAGGAANQIPYQIAESETSFIGAPDTANTYLEWDGADFVWSANPFGTVTSVSVVTGNGLAGTVVNATTTPAITLSSTVTGLVKGNGTALSAAVSATDYVAPSSYASSNGLTMSTNRLLGRTTASTGTAEEISVAGGLSLSAGVLTGTSGTVTAVSVASANGFAGTSSGGATPALTLSTTVAGILYGNGTAVATATAPDFPTLNQNTTGSAATLTTARNIYGNSFNGSADLTQIIASTYGGTGNGFTKFSGATTSEKTYILPNASTTILTTNAAVTISQGGTNGSATPTAGAVSYGSGTAYAFSAAGNAGEFLISGGSGPPTWTATVSGGTY